MFFVVVVVVVIAVCSLFLSSHYNNIIKTNATSTCQLPFKCFSYTKIISKNHDRKGRTERTLEK